MKRSTALILILGILGVCGLVVYATIAQSGGNGAAEAWLAAQRQTPALWALDAAALYTLLLSVSYSGQAGRLQSRSTQVERLHDEHRAQLEAMLANTEKLEEISARQEDQIATQVEKIASQEEAIRILSEQAAVSQQENANLNAEIDARQEAFETEARRLTEQAFRALSGQVDANARQLDAVNLALQYHRAEIRQLRHGLRAVQPGLQPAHVARLTPAEISAITAQEIDTVDPVIVNQAADAPAPPAAETAVPAPDVADHAAEIAPSRVETPQAPTPDELFSEADLNAAYSDNAPATVIMEPIYFRVVPLEEDLPSPVTNGPPEFEQHVAVAAEHNPLSDVVSPDEFSALLSPLPDPTESENQENGHTASPQLEVQASHWQRKL
jgi:hypothetical protein